MGRVEATGAINFLALDDLLVKQEGEPLDPASEMSLPIQADQPLLPEISRSAQDRFLRRLTASGKKWVIVTDSDGEPRFAVDTNKFLRDALFSDGEFAAESHFIRPSIITNAHETVGSALGHLASETASPGSALASEAVILVWTPEHKRVITGSDVLGCLLRGIPQTST